MDRVLASTVDRPSWVRISARGLPTVWPEGRKITLQYCTNKVLNPRPRWAVNLLFLLHVHVLEQKNIRQAVNPLFVL